MIKEELYVIIGGERRCVDMPSPSGITLKWVSNLFNDLSKLTSSYSYTFKLPFTQNNRRIFDLIEDIRYSSAFKGKVVDCDFLINGVCVCPNANLYISEITQKEYSCVMTWRVLKAFNELKDNDVNINQLRSLGTFNWKKIEFGYPSYEYKNTDNILFPNYDAGVPYTDGFPPKPVVPVYKIIQMINERFGTRFDIGREIPKSMGLLPLQNFNNKRYYGNYVYDDYISNGVIPLTGCGISSANIIKYTLQNVGYQENFNLPTGEYVRFLNYKIFYDDLNRPDGYIYDIVYTGTEITDTIEYLSVISFNTVSNLYVIPFYITLQRTESGRIENISKELIRSGNNSVSGDYEYYSCTGKRTFSHTIIVESNPLYPSIKYFTLLKNITACTIVGEAEVCTTGYNEEYLWIYIIQGKISELNTAKFDVLSDKTDEWIGLRSVARRTEGENVVYTFDFGKGYEQRKIKISALDEDSCGFSFWTGSQSVNGVVNYNASFIRFNIDIIPDVNFDIAESELDITRNLPEISCFDFMKNIFYMSGALPRVENDGRTITAMYYNELRDRVNEGIAVDWSDKLVNSGRTNALSIKHTNSKFKKDNYFEMAYSQREMSTSEKEEELEIYGEGYGVISLSNQQYSDSTALFKSVFYPGLKKTLKAPNLFVGRTNIVWTDNRELNYSTKPIYGIVNYRALDSEFEDVTNVPQRPLIKDHGVGFKHIRMNTFEPFAVIEDFYGYLKDILDDFTLVKENVMLNEYDLYNFDESIPVYLSKYNAYFAVSTIQRSKDGMCSVEFVKLPKVEVNYPTPILTDEITTTTVSFLYDVEPCFEISGAWGYTDLAIRKYLLRSIYKANTWVVEEISRESLYDVSSVRWISPNRADLINVDPYRITLSVQNAIRYRVIKKVGYNTVVDKVIEVPFKVYYDDERLYAGEHVKSFSKKDAGQYHILKFIYDLKDEEGNIIETVRKKLYYFVSVANEGVITSDFGIMHDKDDTVLVSDMTIKGDGLALIRDIYYLYYYDSIDRIIEVVYLPEGANYGAGNIEITSDTFNGTFKSLGDNKYRFEPKMPLSEGSTHYEITLQKKDGNKIMKQLYTFCSLPYINIDGMVIDGSSKECILSFPYNHYEASVQLVYTQICEITTLSNPQNVVMLRYDKSLNKIIFELQPEYVYGNTVEVVIEGTLSRSNIAFSKTLYYTFRNESAAKEGFTDFEDIEIVGSHVIYALQDVEKAYVLGFEAGKENVSDVSVKCYGFGAVARNVSVDGFDLYVPGTPIGGAILIIVTANINGETKRIYDRISISSSKFLDITKMDANAVLIIDGNYKLYTPTQWKEIGKSSSEAEGVAVSNGRYRFIIAKEDCPSSMFGVRDIFVPDLSLLVDEETNKYDGEGNSAKIRSVSQDDTFFTEPPYCAVGIVQDADAFPSAKAGYIGACGEWEIVKQYQSLINKALELVGTPLSGKYWTSSIGSDTLTCRVFDTEAAVDNAITEEYRTLTFKNRPFRNIYK